MDSGAQEQCRESAASAAAGSWPAADSSDEDISDAELAQRLAARLAGAAADCTRSSAQTGLAQTPEPTLAPLSAKPKPAAPAMPAMVAMPAFAVTPTPPAKPAAPAASASFVASPLAKAPVQVAPAAPQTSTANILPAILLAAADRIDPDSPIARRVLPQAAVPAKAAPAALRAARGLLAKANGTFQSEAGKRIELVDSASRCRTVCEMLLKQEALAVDIEGVNLGRHGEICITQVADRRGYVYLFDVTTLGNIAFSSGLKTVLEAEGVAKLFFDCRGDADALFHLYGVFPQHVLDMQVLCQKAKGGTSMYVQGFAKALGYILPYADGEAMKGIKEAGQRLFAPDRGGTLQVWKKRPLPEILRRYCAQDVVHLFNMLRQWGNCLPLSTLRAVSEGRMRKRMDSPAPETGPRLARRDFEFPADVTPRAAFRVSPRARPTALPPAAKRPRPLTTPPSGVANGTTAGAGASAAASAADGISDAGALAAAAAAAPAVPPLTQGAAAGCAALGPEEPRTQ